MEHMGKGRLQGDLSTAVTGCDLCHIGKSNLATSDMEVSLNGGVPLENTF